MAMLKVAFAFVAIVALARADIEQEVANERGEIEYRLSFKTRDAEKADDHFHSVGKFSVEFIGKDGTTGPQELIDHPSMVKSDDGSWKKQDGMVQVAKVDAPNVGELKEVKITGDSQDKWHPQWIKVNTNDFHSGEGNGIYYAGTHGSVDKGTTVLLSTDEEAAGVDNYLYKCIANFCEKSEHKYMTEGDDEPPEDDHGGHFGPLGEGMPGTENDPSMTRGHFMREFLAMQHVDEDDEDFLRTHSV